jgi:hypothetical protein
MIEVGPIKGTIKISISQTTDRIVRVIEPTMDLLVIRQIQIMLEEILEIGKRKAKLIVRKVIIRIEVDPPPLILATDVT